MIPSLPLLAGFALGASAPAPPAIDDELVVYSAGLEALLADERDAGLLRALEMVVPRAVELMELSPIDPGAARYVHIALDLSMRPMSLRAGTDENGPHVQLEFVIDDLDRAGRARNAFDLLSGQVTQMLGQRVGGGSGDAEGALAMTTHLEPDGDAARLTLAIGERIETPLVLGSMGLPEGVVPLAAMRGDMRSLQTFAEGFVPGAFDELGPILAAAGMSIDGDYGVETAFGHGEEYSHGAVRMRGWRPVVEPVDREPFDALGGDDLALVPADATYAALAQSYPGAQLTNFLESMDVPIDDFIEEEPILLMMFELTQLLGPRIGMYQSESTGGGGLLSTIVFAEFSDPEHAADRMDELVEELNLLGREYADGYVAFRPVKLAGHAATILTFPGLPVPLEASFARHGPYVLAAASPQALEAALVQAAGGRGDLRDNAAFQDALPVPLDRFFSLQFTDSPTLARDGYGWASLAFAALANAVRSPEDPTREPGQILPGIDALGVGARASVSISYFEGDDLVILSKADRSFVSQGAALVGSAQGLLPAVLLGVGAGALVSVPRTVERLHYAQTGKARIDMNSIKDALDQYAIENGGVYPDSLEALVVLDENGNSYLDSRWIPLDPWGTEYQYTPPAPGTRRFDLFSLGADGELGGYGDDADIHHFE